MNKIQLKAMGKINLGLDVVRRRPDGYHEVKMVMQTVDLYDRISIAVEETPQIQIKTNVSFVPTDESNIIYKAAKLMMEKFHIEKGISVELEKNIPVAAGMAGGSTDAAAILYGMNELFSLGLSQKELMELGVKIGADVPYCIMRGTALSEGIGEILTPLPALPDCWILIAKPPVSVSTKYVYENLHVDTIDRHPDIDGVIEAIKNGDLDAMCGKLENILESVTVKKHPEIAEIKAFIKERGAIGSLMSGSGPTVFGIFRKEDEAQAKSVCEALLKAGLVNQGYVVKPFNP